MHVYNFKPNEWSAGRSKFLSEFNVWRGMKTNDRSVTCWEEAPKISCLTVWKVGWGRAS